MTQDEYAAIFEEWKRRWDERPNDFQNIPDFVREPPKSYGEGAARYFLFLVDEMTADQVK